MGNRQSIGQLRKQGAERRKRSAKQARAEGLWKEEATRRGEAQQRAARFAGDLDQAKVMINQQASEIEALHAWQAEAIGRDMARENVWWRRTLRWLAFWKKR